MIVWARESVIGAKDPGQFVMAALELSGQILVYEEEKYHSIVEDEIVQAQKDATWNLFTKLNKEVVTIFNVDIQ